jgi:hypothetical protein
MSWNLEGMIVTGMYLDMFHVRGRVDISRVKYGGEISHHMMLDEPVEIFNTMRDRVILDHKQVQTVSDR